MTGVKGNGPPYGRPGHGGPLGVPGFQVALRSSPPLTGLIAWYSAQAVTGLADGAEISTWKDLTGLGHDATGANYNGAKPKWKATDGPNSGPAVRFTNGYFTVPSGMFSGLTASEIFINLKADTQSSGSSVHNIRGGSSNEHYTYGGAWYETYASTARRQINSPPDLTVWRRFNVWSAANDWQASLDEVAYSTDAANTVAFGGYQLGIDYTAPGAFNGLMTTVLIYDRKLASSARSEVTTWMKANPSGGAA